MQEHIASLAPKMGSVVESLLLEVWQRQVSLWLCSRYKHNQ